MVCEPKPIYLGQEVLVKNLGPSYIPIYGIVLRQRKGRTVEVLCQGTVFKSFVVKARLVNLTEFSDPKL